jgi:flavin-dependent dehydrogenase
MEIGMIDNESDFKSRYDAIVVGARCAGASTAMLLARAGLQVLLVDRQSRGSDTLSTHAVMRAGILQLHRWGLLPGLVQEGTPPVRRTTFHYGNEELRIDIKADHGVEALYAPRRTVLDRILADAAAEAGADVRYGVILINLRTDSDGRVTGAELCNADGDISVVNAGIVIGADGRQSTVGRLVGAETYLEAGHCSASVYGYFSGLEDDGYHWYFQQGTSASVIPTNNRQHCVFVSVRPEQFFGQFRKNIPGGFMQVLEANSVGFAAKVRAAKLVGRFRGFAGILGYLRQSHGPGWALVGDAGYFKDPLTAHGITDALRDSEILARAVISGGEQALVHYQEERDALSRALFEVTDEIASFEWSLDDIKVHHIRLNAAMKAEVNHIIAMTPKTQMAA